MSELVEALDAFYGAERARLRQVEERSFAEDEQYMNGIFAAICEVERVEAGRVEWIDGLPHVRHHQMWAARPSGRNLARVKVGATTIGLIQAGGVMMSNHRMSPDELRAMADLVEAMNRMDAEDEHSRLSAEMDAMPLKVIDPPLRVGERRGGHGESTVAEVPNA